MEKLGRIIWLATCYGLFGFVFGAVTGVVVGAVMGLIFGGVRDCITFAVWYGVILDGVTFAWTAVLWDDGPGTEFSAFFRLEKAHG
jgi:hypothetical protein